MGYATYTARRDLAQGHTVETVYTLPLELTEFLSSASDNKIKNEMLAGNLRTIYYGRKLIWRVTLMPLPDAESELLREFLESTADGQEFEFDPWGSPGSPSSRRMAVMREDDRAGEQAVVGEGGQSGHVQFSFSIRKVE